MTNGNEGLIFVNSTITSQLTISQYVAALMPQFTPAQVQATVAQYTGIGLDTVFDQATAIMSECTCINLRGSAIMDVLMTVNEHIQEHFHLAL